MRVSYFYFFYFIFVCLLCLRMRVPHEPCAGFIPYAPPARSDGRFGSIFLAVRRCDWPFSSAFPFVVEFTACCICHLCLFVCNRNFSHQIKSLLRFNSVNQQIVNDYIMLYRLYNIYTYTSIEHL